MDKRDYRSRGFPPENGRAIVDLAAADQESLLAIGTFWLDDKDHMLADHVGLCASCKVAGSQGRPFRPAVVPYRRILERGSPQADSYEKEAETIIAGWMRRARRRKSEWTDPTVVAALIERVERDLDEAMESINPTVTRGARIRRKSAKALVRKEAAASLQRLAAVQELLGDEREEEAKEVKHSGRVLSKLVGQKRQREVWALKNRVLKVSRTPPPRALFRNGLLLWRHEEVLEEVRRAVDGLCQPTQTYLLGEPDLAYQDEIRDRHRRIRALASGARDWGLLEEDAEVMAHHFDKVYSGRGASGKSGRDAQLIALAGSTRVALLHMLLLMIAACGAVPSHWLPLIIILALKPGRPAHDLISYRPIVLAELFLKALEKVIKKHYEAALLESPLHPAILAYRPGMSTGIALFTTLEACLQAKLEGRRVGLLCADVKYSYNGADRKKIEIIKIHLSVHRLRIAFIL